MMKPLLVNTALVGLILGSMACPAQTPSATPAAEESALSPVAAAIAKLPTVGATSFNRDAEYFIYLYSASWCGPCRRVMPHIVRFYKETLSKDKRIEIILVNVDRTEEEAKAYLAHYDADFYTIMGINPEVEKQLPGAYQVRSIPHYIAVDKNGNRISGGHASKLFLEVDKLK